MQNVIASEPTLKAASPDRSGRELPASRPEIGRQLTSYAHAPLVQLETPDFAQFVKEPRRNTSPPATVSISGFRQETASPEQPVLLHPTQLAINSAVRFTSVVQPEFDGEPSQKVPLTKEAVELANMEFPEETHASETDAPLNISPPNFAVEPIQHTGAIGPVGVADEAVFLSKAALPTTASLHSVPVLSEPQPGSTTLLRRISGDSVGQQSESRKLAGTEPAIHEFPGGHGQAPGSPPEAPTPPLKLDLIATTGPHPSLKTPDVAARSTARSIPTKPEILQPDSSNHQIVVSPASLGSSTTREKVSLPPASATQLPPLRAYSVVAGAVAETLPITRAVTKEPRVAAPHVELCVANLLGSNVESEVLREKTDKQAPTIPDRQEGRPDDVSRNLPGIKPEMIKMRREGHYTFAAPRNRPAGTLEAHAEKEPANNPGTIVPATQGPGFHAKDIDVSDKLHLPREGVAAPPPTLANITGSVFQDIPDPLLPQGIAVSGTSAISPANPAAPLLATTPDPLVFARISAQLSNMVTQNPDAPIELTLSPEELGRVRMSFSTQEGAINVTIAAERPETLSLLRRHIDVLMQDFRELGYSEVNLGFEDQPAQQNTAEQIPDSSSSDPQAEDAVTNTEMPQVFIDLSALPDGGIDVRL